MWSRSGSTGSDQVDELLRVAEQRPRPARLGSSAVTRNTSPGQHGRDDRRATSTPTFASASCGPSNARLAISSDDGEADAGDGAAAEHRGPADRRPDPARGSAGSSSQDAADDRDRLADDVPEQDAERDRRGERPREERGRRSRCRRWPARTAARSRSWSTGGRSAAAARSATASRSGRRVAVRASSGVGCSRNSRNSPLACSSSSRPGEYAGRGQPDRQPGDDRVDAAGQQRRPHERRRTARTPTPRRTCSARMHQHHRERQRSPGPAASPRCPRCRRPRSRPARPGRRRRRPSAGTPAPGRARRGRAARAGRGRARCRSTSRRPSRARPARRG